MPNRHNLSEQVDSIQNILGFNNTETQEQEESTPDTSSRNTSSNNLEEDLNKDKKYYHDLHTQKSIYINNENIKIMDKLCEKYDKSFNELMQIIIKNFIEKTKHLVE
ncbi:MAG: hypothetical protein ACOCRK_01220 [bacterium]